jgi:uncharacterized secreted protein with C-terminal beta-propeller domain
MYRSHLYWVLNEVVLKEGSLTQEAKLTWLYGCIWPDYYPTFIRKNLHTFLKIFNISPTGLYITCVTNFQEEAILDV